MITLNMLIEKRSDLSDAEFRDYYERRHLPLVARVVGFRPIGYVRNHRISDSAAGRLVDRLARGRGESVDHSVAALTQIVVADHGDLADLVEAMLAPEVAVQLADDESHFIAPGGVRWFVTEATG